MWHTKHTIQWPDNFLIALSNDLSEAIYIVWENQVKLNPNKPRHQASRMSRANVTEKKINIDKKLSIE